MDRLFLFACVVECAGLSPSQWKGERFILKTRVLTALALIPIALLVLLSVSTWPIAVLACAIVYLGSRELTYLYSHGKSKISLPSPFFMLATALVALDPRVEILHFGLAFAALACVVGIVGVALMLRGRRTLPVRALASGWLMGPLLGLVVLHAAGKLGPGPMFGWNLVLLAVLPIWAGDTAAIFAGKAFGKKLMAPSISPGKTWAGSYAYLLSALLVGYGLGISLGVGSLPGMLCGLLCGTLGQAGDLLESALKRSSGVKDSGSLLPGHGGILDRIDSLLLPAIPVAAILMFWPR